MSNNSGFWTQIWVLLVWIFIGFLLTMGAMFALNSVLPDLGLADVAYLHIIQWCQTIFVCILPALVFCKLRKETLAEGLRLKSPVRWSQVLVGVVGALVLAYPMEWLGEAIKAIPFWPESMRASAEAQAIEQQQILGVLLSLDGPLGWLELVMLMSIATAIGEELVFRGAMLRCFKQQSGYNHFAAIVVGFVFALIHFDLYGLIPRWIMGALLCYLVMWSGSLWPSIAAHAVNNFIALIDSKCFDS